MKNLINAALLSLALILFCGYEVNGAPNKEKKKKSTVSIRKEVKEIALDPSLKLEPWMLKPELFSTTATDQNVKLEPWMLNAEEFVNSQSDTSAMDSKVKLENWMTDFRLWKNNGKANK